MLSSGGSMTFTSSIAAFSPPRAWRLRDDAASAAVASLARSLAAERRPVRVNAIARGTFVTGVWAELGAIKAKTFRTSAAESLPVGHLGQAEELAHAFLTISAFGLDASDFRLEPGDFRTWEASLESAVAAKKPVILPLWKPYYLNVVHRLRVLADPKNVLGPANRVVLGVK